MVEVIVPELMGATASPPLKQFLESVISAPRGSSYGIAPFSLLSFPPAPGFPKWKELIFESISRKWKSFIAWLFGLQSLNKRSNVSLQLQGITAWGMVSCQSKAKRWETGRGYIPSQRQI